MENLIEKTQELKDFWMVVWEKETGDFLNVRTTFVSGTEQSIVAKSFEQNNPSIRVIHIGKGSNPPKTYRSLPYYRSKFH